MQLEGLPPPHVQQRRVIAAVQKGDSVIVTAAAGSGKTTLALHMCAQYPREPTIIVTFNRALKDGCTQRLKKHGLRHVECHTLHSLIGELYHHTCPNDGVFLDLMARPLPKPLKVSRLIIDEMQDLRPLYHRFLTRVLATAPITPQLVLVGDPHQKIYDFFNTEPADERFLLLADRLWRRPFVKLPLSVSFRLTPRLAEMVRWATGSDVQGVNTHAPDDVPELWVDYPASARTVNLIAEAIHAHGAGGVLILTNSLRNPCVRRVVNLLVQRRFRFNLSGKGASDQEVDVQTFCSAKGLERRVVFLFGLESQVAWFGLHRNQLYVALTRCCGGRLVIVQDASMPTVDQVFRNPHVRKMCLRPLRPRVIPRQGERHQLGRLCQFMESHVLRELQREFVVGQLRLPPQSSPVLTDARLDAVRFGSQREDMRDVLVRMVSVAWAHRKTGLWPFPLLSKLCALPLCPGQVTPFDYYRQHFKFQFPVTHVAEVHQLIRRAGPTAYTWVEYAQLAMASLAFGGYFSSLFNVTHFDWVPEAYLDRLWAQLDMYTVTGFRQMVQGQVGDARVWGLAAVVGRGADGATEVWRLEWCESLKHDALLGLAATVELGQFARGHLFNLATNEWVTIEVKPKLLERILECKRAEAPRLTDAEFVATYAMAEPAPQVETK